MLRDADSLETIEVQSGSKNFCADGICLYNADKTFLYGIARSANQNKYIVADNTTRIYPAAFASSNITDIMIPKSVTILDRTSLYTCKDIYYMGSQDEWNKIETNYAYYNPSIHFNATGMEPPKINAVNQLNNNVEITIEDAEYDSRLIAVSSDGDEQMVSVDMLDVQAGDTVKTVNIGDGAKTVKVFIWDSLESMKPLCPAIEIAVE